MIDFLISAFVTATLLLLGVPFAIGCDTLLHYPKPVIEECNCHIEHPPLWLATLPLTLSNPIITQWEKNHV